MIKAYRGVIEYWGWAADLMVRRGDMEHASGGCNALSVRPPESQTPLHVTQVHRPQIDPQGVGVGRSHRGSPRRSDLTRVSGVPMEGRGERMRMLRKPPPLPHTVGASFS